MVNVQWTSNTEQRSLRLELRCVADSEIRDDVEVSPGPRHGVDRGGHVHLTFAR